MAQTTVPNAGSWRAQYNDIIRSFTGAFLFGIPFIYTMEMWWIASYLEVWKILSFLAVAIGINVVLGHLVFLEEQTPWHTAAGEALFNFAVGTVGAALILFLLGRFVAGDPLREILGKILLEAIPLSIGAAVTHRIERRQRAGRENRGSRRRLPSRELILTQLGITAAGALFLSLPLSSTAEIQFLAAGTATWQTVALVFFSLLAIYMTVYRNHLAPTLEGSVAENPLPLFTDTLMTYVVALLAATLTLYLFDRIEFGNPLLHVVTQIVVLGLPAAVGGAAGRRLI